MTVNDVLPARSQVHRGRSGDLNQTICPSQPQRQTLSSSFEGSEIQICRSIPGATRGVSVSISVCAWDDRVGACVQPVSSSVIVNTVHC